MTVAPASSASRLLHTAGTGIVATLLLLIALTHFTRRFDVFPWNDMGHAVQALWGEYILSPATLLFGEWTHFVLVVFGTFVLHMTTFWSHCAVLTYIDTRNTSLPSLLQWKVQPKDNAPLPSPRLWVAVRQALFNQLCVNVSFAVLTYPLFRSRCRISSDSLPSLEHFFYELLVYIVIEEIGFYYGHRALHHPAVYKYIHKQHHEFIAPISIAAIYAHPLEHVLSNLSPIIAGPLLLRSHLLSYWLWLTVAVFSTITSHSGYHFPYLPSPEFHDFHHLKYDNNYGVIGWLDLLHGTDSKYAGSVQESRDVTFLSGDAETLMRRRKDD